MEGGDKSYSDFDSNSLNEKYDAEDDEEEEDDEEDPDEGEASGSNNSI